MRKYAVPSMLTALIFSFGLLTPAPAHATVTICWHKVCVCITGKKNPHGCDFLTEKNKNVRVAVVDDAIMADLDRMQGQKIKVEPVVTRKTSGFEAEYSGATGASERAAGDPVPGIGITRPQTGSDKEKKPD